MKLIHLIVVGVALAFGVACGSAEESAITTPDADAAAAVEEVVIEDVVIEEDIAVIEVETPDVAADAEEEDEEAAEIEAE